MGEYLVVSRVVRPELAPKYRDSHLSYLTRLKDEGKLILAGRFTDGTGGAYIVSASSLGDAESLAKNDPYHANGVRTYSVHAWERRF